MHTESAIDAPASPAAAIPDQPVGPATEAPGVPPAAAPSGGGRDVVRRLLRQAMSVLRGDKYMVGAYPPDWPDPSTTPSKERGAMPTRPPRRLCRSCAGPMARQEDTCWRCGAQCADEPQRA